MKELSENTKISLGLAVLAIGGAAFWLGVLQSNVSATENKVSQIEAAQVKYSEELSEVNEALARIEGQLNHIKGN